MPVNNQPYQSPGYSLKWGQLLKGDVTGTLPNTTTIPRLHNTLVLSITGDTTLTAAQTVNTGYEISGPVSGVTSLVFPNTFTGFAVITNFISGTDNLIVGYATGTNVILANGDITPVWADGNNFYKLSSGGTVDVTGSGLFVLQTSPTIITPTITSPIIDVSLITKTANYSVATTDSGAYFTNSGAAGSVTFTLPTAAAGLIYSFVVATAQTVEILAGASTTISFGTTVSAAAGNITSNSAVSTVTLLGVSSTSWVVLAATGSWTIT